MRPLKTYNQAVEALLSLNNLPVKQYMKDPKQCALYIKRLQWLLNRVGNPEKKLRFIHVAGTSGKGSVTTMLHEMLRAAGYRVGSYTSPYVSTFTERWHLDGKLIHPDDLVACTNRVLTGVERAVLECPEGPTSFFETLVAIALVYFNEKKCDWVVLETGCGGDFDATNVIPSPHLAVITSIGLDHTELLGKTRAAIARRKAGIFKPKTIAVIGEDDPAIAQQLKRYATAARAKKIIMAGEYPITNIAVDERGTTMMYRGERWRLGMVGTFQAHNARVAIEAARALKLPINAIIRGLGNARIPGRAEIMQTKPVVMLDGAHNQDKMKGIMDTVAALYPKQPLSCLVAATDNENKERMFDALFRRARRIAVTRFTTHHRPALDPRKLFTRAKSAHPHAETRLFLSPHDGLQYLLERAAKDEIILVTGSFFLVGDVRTRWMPEHRIITKQNPFV